MATAPKAETKGPNQLAYENGWGQVAIPIRPYKKAPVWDGWSNPQLKYDPNELGYEPEGFDFSGCGVGIRCGIDIGTGYGVWAFDIDVLDWQLVGEIMQVVRDHLGVDIVTREGNAPKVLVPVLVKLGELDDWKPTSIKLGNGHKIEMWYKGRQFVVDGIHPDTGKAYRCSVPVLKLGPECLLVLSGTQVKDLWRALDTKFGVSKDTDEDAEVAANGPNGNSYTSQALDVASTLRKLSQGHDIHENLTSLTASLVNSGMDADMVRDWLKDKKVLESLPRDINRVGDIDDDRSEIGRAIVGAVQKYAKGSRWEYNHEVLTTGVSGHKEAVTEFGTSKVADNDNPFAVPSEAEMEVERLVRKVAVKATVAPLKTVSSGWGKDPKSLPLTKFLDEAQTFLKGAVMALQGKPGTNKSTWAMNYVWCLMTGVGAKEFGAVMRLNPDGTICKTDEERVSAGKKLKVLYLSADDPTEVVEKRLAAWRLHWKASQADMDGLDGRFFVHSVTEGVMGLSLDKPEGRKRLRELLDREKFDVVVGDPAANLIPQSDSGNDEALATLKEIVAEMSAAGVAAAFIWHVNKAANGEGAESKLDDIRGASAIGGAVRGAKDLRYLNESECREYGLDPRGDGRWYRKMSHTKNSYGPVQADAWFKVVGVDLLNDGTGLGGDSAAVLERVDIPGNGKPLTDVDIQEFLNQLWTAAGAGKHYTDGGRSKTRDVFALAKDQFDWGRGRTKEVLTLLEREGNITIGDVQLKGRSANNLTRGISVCNDYWGGTAHTANELDPFDPNP